MLTQAVIISSVLTTSPPSRVEVEQTDDSISVLAYDDRGDVAAEIVEWHDGANLRIDATFPDGVYLSAEVRADGDTTVDDAECV